MKPGYETASFHNSCRPAVATLYLLRSPVKTVGNSCGNNCWIQPTNKFNKNKLYWRYRTIQFCEMSPNSVTFVGVAEVFCLLKVKLNLKICTRPEPLLIFFLKTDCFNKSYEKNRKIHVKQFIFRYFNSRVCNFTEKWTSSQMILKNAYLKGHLLVTASKWRWFYDFQALWEIVKTWSLQVLCKI